MSEELEVKRIICNNGAGGCFAGCGLLAYIDKKTGKIVKVEGNPEHPISKLWVVYPDPFSQEKFVCYDRATIPDFPARWLYHPDQLMYALKRVGERGEGKWQRISYEQALDEIAEKLKELRDKYGPECVAFIEGTMRSDTFWARSRFAYLFGNPLNLGDPSTICHHPGTAVEQCMAGAFSREWPEMSSETRYVVLVGTDIKEAFPPLWAAFTLNRENIYAVCVDPRLTETARCCDMWLQIRPGTDCALFLGWIHILMKEGLFDKDFVLNWTNAPFLVRTDVRKLLRESDIRQGGSRENFVVWDTMRNAPAIWISEEMIFQPQDAKPSLSGTFKVKLVDGKEVECKTVWDMLWERVSKYTPEYVEEITWIPAEKIIETARMFWTRRPGGIGAGVSLYQAGKNASDNHIAMVIIHLITGNYGVKGGIWPLLRARPGPVINGKLVVRESELEGQEFIKPETKLKQIGMDQYKVMSWAAFDLYNKYYQKVWGIPQNSGGHTLTVSMPLIWRAILTGKPYPIKALIIWSGNPIMWAPNTKLVIKALKSSNLELCVVQDYFMTPTAALADYVLPAAAKGLEVPYCCNWEDYQEAVVVGENAVKPMGDRHSDYELFRGLAIRLGFGEYFPWKNNKEAIEYRLSRAGIKFEDAIRMGLLTSNTPGYLPEEDKPWALIDPKTGKPRGFTTPSRRAEIWSSILEDLGYDPLPEHEEPFESPVRTPELAKEYPLILTTGGRFRPMFHSEYRQWGMGFREQNPWPRCDIHYETARKLGIVDGDWVWIETRRGRILQRARVGPHIHPQVVNIGASWWYPELPTEEPWLGGALISNANVLTEDDPSTLDEKTGAWYCRALLCRVYKAKPEEIPKFLLGK
ncbi:MAG: molybdopterin-dependent oxidoreductase [Candidatus Bathyarchaeia archaeon]